ncbi:hypothetical protein [uncultured Psychroserpens sp.]|uniref:hypothetical protein n=1 Tax=uncultured Psychroserpens sp. TaxID=255436 RepID=UPI00262CCEF5|nr:hypothetical protein [uncultured Psychroserpens sp.]
MKLVNSTDLKHWADTLESKSLLPLLIRKLILSGIKIENVKRIEFPYGDDIQTGGYDGDLETEEGNLYIPEGNSVWEFGVTEKKKKKADEDYEKRTKNPLGKVQSETSYINVTLKKYTKKNDWAEEKKAEGIWADVRFYDAVDIEHWLELAPSVEIWLSEHLGKPVNGVYCADEYWEQWSTKESLKFPEQLLVESRLQEEDKLKTFLNGDSGKVSYIKSSTSEESLAFILAVIENMEVSLKDSIHAKTLIVENQNSFRKLIQTKKPLFLIPKFLVEDVDMNNAISRGHTLIVPVSNSYSSSNDNVINLPIVSYEVFIENLQKMGVDSEQSKLFAKNAGRDISVLRRSLDFSSKKPLWINDKDASLFIPFLLISRYDSSIEGDREIIEQISGEEYDSYSKYLNQVLHKEGTPLYNIGSKWRLISHADSWVYLSRFVTEDVINKFEELAVTVLSETNPKYGLDPEKRYMAAFYNARPKYSNYLKKGICETLIVLSTLAENYELSALDNPKSFVDRVVENILKLADSNALRSIGYNLPLLAEASPEVFISELQNAIEDKRVLGFFEEEKGLLTASNDLPNLLWALESIAWMPDYLTNVVRVLCKLIKLQPEKLPMTNSPLNTMKSIFRIWFPQTNANMNERKQVLEILKKEYPEVAFQLFSGMLYSGSDTAFPTHKMRWRLFSETRRVSVTNQEVYNMHEYSVDSLIELTRKGDISMARVLVDKLDDINWNKIDDVLSCFDVFINEDEENKAVLYHEFRKLIGRHRTYSKTDWSLPEEQLLKMESKAKEFEPTNIILAKSFLFEDHPEFIEGVEELVDDYEKREKELNKLRDEFVSEVIEKFDLQKVIDLAKKTENPYAYAQSLVNVALSDNQEREILTLLKSKDSKEKWLLTSYIGSKERIKGRKETLDVFERLYEEKVYDYKTITQVLLAMRVDFELFRYIDSLENEEIEEAYWVNQNWYIPRDEDAVIFAVEKYMKYKRPIAVLNTLGRTRITKKLDSTFLVETLENLDLNEINEPENARVNHHFIREVFSDLQDREALDIERMAGIEYKYLFIFDRLGNGVSPKYLYQATAKSPSIYMDFIKNQFFPEDEELKEKEIAEYNPEVRKLMGENAYRILSNFNLIPGLQPDGSIIEDELNTWVDEVRILGSENHRSMVTDRKIGELLARYPNGDKPIFFPETIFDTLERLSSEDVYFGFRMQVFNRQSFTSRAAGSGGYIERDRAEHFNSLADEIKITHPNVAGVFRGLSDGYLKDAKRMDDSALQDSLD